MQSCSTIDLEEDRIQPIKINLVFTIFHNFIMLENVVILSCLFCLLVEFTFSNIFMNVLFLYSMYKFSISSTILFQWSLINQFWFLWKVYIYYFNYEVRFTGNNNLVCSYLLSVLKVYHSKSSGFQFLFNDIITQINLFLWIVYLVSHFCLTDFNIIFLF